MDIEKHVVDHRAPLQNSEGDRLEAIIAMGGEEAEIARGILDIERRFGELNRELDDFLAELDRQG